MEKRLDIFLFENHFFSSRSLAKDAIVEGNVIVNGKIVLKASFKVDDKTNIEVIEKEVSFASRAGNKLYGALKAFGISLQDKVVLDIGASSGGFTDVCLSEGASFVYALDAGKDQLIQRLKEDPRVKSIEGINCRYLETSLFDKKIDFVCMDVSFISIKLIVDAILTVVEPPFIFLFLVKPQFEVGREYIKKKGIVKDKKLHYLLIKDFIQYFNYKGLGIKHIRKSDIIGRDGNQEYLFHLSSDGKCNEFDIKKII